MRLYNQPTSWKKDSLRWNIYKVGVVMDLTISVWGARAKLNPEDLGFKEVPEIVKLGHKELMKKERLAKISTIVSQAWAYLYNHSFAFPFGDARFVPATLIEEVIAKENEFKALFEAAVNDFVEHYEEYRAEMISKWNEAFSEILMKQDDFVSQHKKQMLLRKLDEKYPNVYKLQGKFGFDLSIFEVSTPMFSSLSQREAKDGAVEHQTEEAIYAKKVSEKLDTFLDDVVDKLRKMILDTVSHVGDMSDAGNLGGRTVKAFLRFADSFRKLDFVGFDVDQQIEALSQKLSGAKKSDFTDKEFKEELQKDLTEIHDKVVNADVILGRFKRTIEAATEVS